jgi:hypothetical protein
MTREKEKCYCTQASAKREHLSKELKEGKEGAKQDLRASVQKQDRDLLVKVPEQPGGQSGSNKVILEEQAMNLEKQHRRPTWPHRPGKDFGFTESEKGL